MLAFYRKCLDGFHIAAFVPVDERHAQSGYDQPHDCPHDEPVPQGHLPVQHRVAQLGDDIAGGIDADHQIAHHAGQLHLRIVKDTGHIEQQPQPHADNVGQVLKKDTAVEQEAAEAKGQQKEQQQVGDDP